MTQQHPVRLITIDVNSQETIDLVAEILDEDIPGRKLKNRKLANHLLYRLRMARNDERTPE